ncbi:hypothetical protein RHGRI_037291 [Rhododendron griersonianum]|uniref:Stigma-specific STIG1-like protein 1 n=1 Tax=Rhododendron griersonianum TaxID=479676 RepID=A0AAV6HV83_9ERIC|nr:hypothetical protein RHGRI_037291 [Rhododendron griersonianum]
MESLKIFLVLLLTITSSFVALSAASGWSLPPPPVASAGYTCDKHLAVCTVAGSVNPNYCKKMCMNLNTDILNCGSCGNKCGLNLNCCNWKIVNLHTNEKHCGRCQNNCKKDDACMNGICEYA